MNTSTISDIDTDYSYINSPFWQRGWPSIYYEESHRVLRRKIQIIVHNVILPRIPLWNTLGYIDYKSRVELGSYGFFFLTVGQALPLCSEYISQEPVVNVLDINTFVPNQFYEEDSEVSIIKQSSSDISMSNNNTNHDINSDNIQNKYGGVTLPDDDDSPEVISSILKQTDIAISEWNPFHFLVLVEEVAKVASPSICWALFGSSVMALPTIILHGSSILKSMFKLNCVFL